MSYENQLNEFKKDLALIGDYKSICIEKLIQAYGFWEYVRGIKTGEYMHEEQDEFSEIHRKRTDISEEIYRHILEVIKEEREKANG